MKTIRTNVGQRIISRRPTHDTNRCVPNSLFNFMESVIHQYYRNGQFRTGETYHSTLNSFKRFRKYLDIGINEINHPLLNAYISYLKREGLSHNTISFYLHRLMAVYNQAIEYGMIEESYPFRKLKMNIRKTVKRAIPVHYIKQIKNLPLPAGTTECFARDMFLFSFYTRGMSFVDMAYLQKSNLKDGILHYRRKKTGQELTIQWESCMQDIVDRYSHRDSLYLLNILREDRGEDYRKQYHSAQSLINRHLRKIGRELRIDTPLTMYVARHSWATIAHQEGVPIAVISEGMGHDSEKTTRIYLASIDNRAIDLANQKILHLI